jgi:hypothetical protein
MRDVISRACVANPKLSGRQWRVLSAVLALTASYSKLSDRIYLGQLASVVYGVERATRSQTVNVGRELAVLADRGLIDRKAPRRGAKGVDSRPDYFVGIAARPDSKIDAEADDNARALLSERASIAVGSGARLLSGSGDLPSSSSEKSSEAPAPTARDIAEIEQRLERARAQLRRVGDERDAEALREVVAALTEQLQEMQMRGRAA